MLYKWPIHPVQPQRALSRKRSVRILNLAAILMGLVALLVFYSMKVEPYWLQTTQIDLPMRGLPQPFDSYRIVQISDLHLGPYLSGKPLMNAIQRVNALQPDLVVITGDFFIMGSESYAGELQTALSQIQARDGVIASLGNHDHWLDPLLVRQTLESAGVMVLQDDVTVIRQGDAEIYVAGLDSLYAGMPDLSAVLEKLPLESFAILLMHEPDYADQAAATGRFRLQLSGHSHGGQISLPFFGPLALPGYAQKYPSGSYRVGVMEVYTNRGIGMNRFWARFNARPEVSLFVLQAE